MAKPEDIAVEVTEEDFDRAQRELVPSVSESELDHYKKVRERFEGKMKDGRAEEGEEEEKDWGGKTKVEVEQGKGKGKGKGKEKA